MDCLEQQTTELQLIVSMYPEQLSFFDPVLREIVTAADPIAELANKRSFLLMDTAIEFIFALPDTRIEINFTLPSDYPRDRRLEAHVRLLDTDILNAALKRMQVAANERLNRFLDDADEANVLTVIQWISEYSDKTLEAEATSAREERTEHESGPSSNSLNSSSKDSPGRWAHCRLWIYSHHIYAMGKRKLIVELSHNLNLRGFSRPGKPGFVCVEGAQEDCDEFWKRIRFENWQRITVIAKELDEPQDKGPEVDDGLDCPAKSSSGDSEKAGIGQIFDKFEELLIDQSDFIKFLEARGCANIIREYLGWSSSQDT